MTLLDKQKRDIQREWENMSKICNEKSNSVICKRMEHMNQKIGLGHRDKMGVWTIGSEVLNCLSKWLRESGHTRIVDQHPV